MKTNENNNESKEIVLLIQKELIKLFSVVAKILDDSKIKHGIHSGTLLGGYRDGGFIEGDDDIDIMVSYKEGEDGYHKLLNLLDENDLELFDFSIKEPKIGSRLKNARIYSREKVSFVSQGKKHTFYPYIDIFFSSPVDHFKCEKTGIGYEGMYKINWVGEPGFNRFNQRGGNVRIFGYNLISYPLKILFPNKKIIKFLESPKQSNGNGDYLTRFDYGTHRKTYYKPDEMIEVDFLGVKTYANNDIVTELELTFGKNGNVKKYRDPHFAYKVSTTSISNRKIKDYLDKKLYK